MSFPSALWNSGSSFDPFPPDTRLDLRLDLKSVLGGVCGLGFTGGGDFVLVSIDELGLGGDGIGDVLLADLDSTIGSNGVEALSCGVVAGVGDLYSLGLSFSTAASSGKTLSELLTRAFSAMPALKLDGISSLSRPLPEVPNGGERIKLGVETSLEDVFCPTPSLPYCCRDRFRSAFQLGCGGAVSLGLGESGLLMAFSSQLALFGLHLLLGLAGGLVRDVISSALESPVAYIDEEAFSWLADDSAGFSSLRGSVRVTGDTEGCSGFGFSVIKFSTGVLVWLEVGLESGFGEFSRLAELDPIPCDKPNAGGANLVAS